MVLAADTNAFHAFFGGGVYDDKMSVMRDAFDKGVLLLPPPVVSEMLSEPTLLAERAIRLTNLPLLRIWPGYWHRAGRMRAALRERGSRAHLGDCLIAQSCIDAKLPLITYDHDFERFVQFGLKLL
jgi:predicted nucleic acid-binding protein